MAVDVSKHVKRNTEVRFAQSGDGCQCFLRDADGITADAARTSPEEALAAAEKELEAKRAK